MHVKNLFVITIYFCLKNVMPLLNTTGNNSIKLTFNNNLKSASVNNFCKEFLTYRNPLKVNRKFYWNVKIELERNIYVFRCKFRNIVTRGWNIL